MTETWTNAISGANADVRRAMEFLYEHLPVSDMDTYPVGLFLEFAQHAVSVRESLPWCGELDWEIFCHYVLFPRVNDEDISPHRVFFHEQLMPRIDGMTDLKEIVLETNRWCHEHATYQAQDARTASPMTVYQNGIGRCGEESTFLVSALRSIGMAARQVYSPRWAHCDDNHAWVEVLIDGKWYFLGACEPEPVLNLGWFNTGASRAMLIHSRIFGEGTSTLHGEAIGSDGIVNYYNQTTRYAPIREYVFRAMANGAPAAGARFEIQLLNESTYATIAALTADENGEARAHLGLGTLHCTAALNGLWAEGDLSPDNAEITLDLAAPALQTDWLDFNVYAPQASDINRVTLTAEQREARAETLKHGNSLRDGSYDIAPDISGEILEISRRARANHKTIDRLYRKFGEEVCVPFLNSVSDKDLRDTEYEVFEDFIANRPPKAERLPDDIYWKYVASPRIGLEKLTKYRSELDEWLGSQEYSPESLCTAINDRLQTVTDGLYPNLCWTPDRALQSERCDQFSKDLLFVACMRILGVPARLNPRDNTAEYWQDGKFKPLCSHGAGSLHVTYPADITLTYLQNWSLSQRTESGWQVFETLEADQQNGELTVSLPAGCYRVITSVRLPNGNQFASRRDFEIAPGTETDLELHFRPYELFDLLRCQEMPALSAETRDGAAVENVFRSERRASLLFWLEEGAEPTEHVLNELYEKLSELANLPIDLTFLLRSHDALENPTVRKVVDALDGVRVLYGNWAYNLEITARALTVDPDTPPLAMVCDSACRAIYGVSGYHVGSVELLLRIAAHLCRE